MDRGSDLVAGGRRGVAPRFWWTLAGLAVAAALIVGPAYREASEERFWRAVRRPRWDPMAEPREDARPPQPAMARADVP